nr:thiol peroxidase [Bacilli bacterium]
MSQERVGVVTFGGNPVTLLGPEIKVGDQAPNATLVDNGLKPVSIEDYQGKVRLISVVPSLDTGVCDAQTRRFNEEASKLGDDVVILTISADLPFGQKRWCGAAGIDRVVTLSDHRDMSFGSAFGTYIKELRIDTRAVFVVDRDGKVTYVEYLKEVGQHPDYDQAVEAVKNTFAG